jgi:hypothetical protein
MLLARGKSMARDIFPSIKVVGISTFFRNWYINRLCPCEHANCYVCFEGDRYRGHMLLVQSKLENSFVVIDRGIDKVQKVFPRSMS